MTKIIDVEQNDLFGVWYFQCLSLLNRPKTCIFQTLTQSQRNPQMCFLKGLRTLYNEAGWADCVLETVIIGKRDRYHSVCVCVCAKWGGHFPKGERATWIGKSPSDPHSALLPHFRLWACQNRSPHTGSSGRERDRLRGETYRGILLLWNTYE